MIMKLLPRILLIAALSIPLAKAQVNQEFTIDSIIPDMVKSPEFNIGIGPKKRSNNKDWLEVEVEFSWQPRGRVEVPFTDELTFNYYILLNNKSPKAPQGTLLVGNVTHVAVAVGKKMRSVMYVSPRTLERFFDGKIPTNASSAIIDVGVTITKQGQLVAESSWKGRGQWWAQMQQVPGYVLNKNETPFAPLFWDYYESIKARGSSY